MPTQLASMLPPNPIVQPTAIDTKYEELKIIMTIQTKALEALQAFVVAKKDPEIVEIMMRLSPLAENVYDEVFPAKYNMPTFTKFDRDGNP